MQELLIIERKIAGYKKAIKDNKDKKIYCFKCKLKYWWYKRKYKKVKSKLENTRFYKK